MPVGKENVDPSVTPCSANFAPINKAKSSAKVAPVTGSFAKIDISGVLVVKSKSIAAY